MEPGVLVIIQLILRIVGVVVCSNKAKELNRTFVKNNTKYEHVNPPNRLPFCGIHQLWSRNPYQNQERHLFFDEDTFQTS